MSGVESMRVCRPGVGGMWRDVVCVCVVCVACVCVCVCVSWLVMCVCDVV